jgi:hypothetical protein
MEDPKGNSYYLEIEEWFINRIKEVLGDSNLEADVDFFAGDTNTREDLVVLEQKANRKTQILDSGSVPLRMRAPDLSIGLTH